MIEMATVLVRSAERFAGRYSHVNWALADQAMVSGINFGTMILLARYLGIEEFGRFTLAWMVVLFSASVQHAAINAPMMSIGAKQSDAEKPAYYGSVIVQQVVFATLTFILVFVCVNLANIWFPQWSIDGFALPVASAAVAYQAQDFLRRYFFSRGRGSAAFAGDALRYGGQLVLLSWLCVTVAEIDSRQSLWAIAGAATLATASAAFLIEPLRWNLDVARRVARRHWHFSKWLVPSALMQWTTGQLFIIMTGVLLGAAAVGALKAAQSLVGVTHILFQGLENLVPVRAARHYRRCGAPGLKAYLSRVAWRGGLVTALMGLVFVLVPEFWLSLVFGSDYSGYGYLVRWYALVYLLLFLALPLSAGLNAIEQTRSIFWAYLTATLFSVVMVYPMISIAKLHGVGAGLAILNGILISILLVGLRVVLGSHERVSREKDA